MKIEIILLFTLTVWIVSIHALAEPIQTPLAQQKSLLDQHQELTDRSRNLFVTAEKQSDKNAAILQQVEKEMVDREKQAERHQALLEKAELELAKREEQLKRFDAILGTWERQQKEYQRYLDSLSTARKGG